MLCFFKELLSSILVLGNIVICVGDIFLRKILPRFFTVRSGGERIENYFFIGHDSLPAIDFDQPVI